MAALNRTENPMKPQKFETNAAIQSIEMQRLHRVLNEDGSPWQGGDQTRALTVDFERRLAIVVEQSGLCRAVHGGRTIREFASFCDVGYHGSCIALLDRDEVGNAAPSSSVLEAAQRAESYGVTRSSSMVIEFVAEQKTFLVHADPESMTSYRGSPQGREHVFNRWTAEQIAPDLFDSRDALHSWMAWVAAGRQFIDCDAKDHPNVAGRPAYARSSATAIVWSSALSPPENQKLLNDYQTMLESQRAADQALRLAELGPPQIPAPAALKSRPR